MVQTSRTKNPRPVRLTPLARKASIPQPSSSPKPASSTHQTDGAAGISPTQSKNSHSLPAINKAPSIGNVRDFGSGSSNDISSSRRSLPTLATSSSLGESSSLVTTPPPLRESLQTPKETEVPRRKSLAAVAKPPRKIADSGHKTDTGRGLSVGGRGLGERGRTAGLKSLPKPAPHSLASSGGERNGRRASAAGGPLKGGNLKLGKVVGGERLGPLNLGKPLPQEEQSKTALSGGSNEDGQATAPQHLDRQQNANDSADNVKTVYDTAQASEIVVRAATAAHNESAAFTPPTVIYAAPHQPQPIVRRPNPFRATPTPPRPPPPDPDAPPPPLSLTLRRIPIRALVDTITPILSHPVRPYTPLILDRSRRVDLFFQYSADFSGIFIEAKKMLLDTIVHRRTTHAEAMETCRRALVAAMKYGRTLVISMADSATDFAKKFTSETEFPAHLVMEQGGRRFANEEELRNKVIRDEDLECGVFVVREGFRVVITSMFLLEEYEEFLRNSLPLNEMIPVYVEPDGED
ncbi:hypothetical protein HK104_008444 [Borealophlyctis nickersoniae]|nr:hypothetical protein HK104_008444 [Borealophlyctis nickersoniae]